MGEGSQANSDPDKDCGPRFLLVSNYVLREIATPPTYFDSLSDLVEAAKVVVLDGFPSTTMEGGTTRSSCALLVSEDDPIRPLSLVVTEQ